MFDVVIQLREMEGNRLAISVEPHYNDATKMERGGAEILRVAVDAAIAELISDGDATIDLKDTDSDAWRRHLFGGK